MIATGLIATGLIATGFVVVFCQFAAKLDRYFFEQAATFVLRIESALSQKHSFLLQKQGFGDRELSQQTKIAGDMPKLPDFVADELHKTPQQKRFFSPGHGKRYVILSSRAKAAGQKRTRQANWFKCQRTGLVEKYRAHLSKSRRDRKKRFLVTWRSMCLLLSNRLEKYGDRAAGRGKQYQLPKLRNLAESVERYQIRCRFLPTYPPDSMKTPTRDYYDKKPCSILNA